MHRMSGVNHFCQSSASLALCTVLFLSNMKYKCRKKEKMVFLLNALPNAR
jgi:hypothetical protein